MHSFTQEVQIGEKFHAEVRSLASDGTGVVAHPKGRVFFVAGVWPGDQGEFEVVVLEKRFGSARLLELTKLSENRRKAPCEHQGAGQGKCGGCSWMIGNYDSQLKHKELRLQYALERSSLKVENLLPIIPSEKEFSYRNRAQFKTEGTVLGYVSASSKTLAPIEKCLILNEKMQTNLEVLLGALPKSEWKPDGRFLWNFIDVDDEQSLSHSALDVQLNQRRPFRQGNYEQNLVMREWVLNKLRSMPPVSLALELYCGAGNFTEILVDAGVAKILAVESLTESLKILNRKQLRGVESLFVDLSKLDHFQKLTQKASDAELLLLDPPREGAKNLAVIVQKLKKLRHLVYISCDVATFVRDAAKLTDQGFRIVEIQPVDVFPQTPHLETLAIFSK